MPHTLQQLEAFVSSPAYDAETAGLIARGIPELPRYKGEQIAPGITRIHGNLCNVHGRYGPCDKAASGKKKPGKGRKPAKPKQTPEQRTAARDAEHQANRAAVFSKLGLFEDATAALTNLRDGKPVTDDGGLVKMGLAEQASDGSYRLTPTGRALMAAANAGDTGRARDIISRGTDAQGKRTERTAAQAKRQQDSAGKRAAATMGRELSKRERQQAQAKRQAEAAAKKPAKAAGGGGKKPEKPAIEKPRRAAPVRRMRRNQAPSIGGVAGAGANKKPPSPAKAAQPAKAPAKQLAPALQEAATALSQGKEMTDDQVMELVRNGLVKLNKDGVPVLTAAGQRAAQVTTKAQTAEDRAMFAKMGGGGSGGGGGGSGGGSKLWPKGPSGKRTPQAAAAQSGGGSGSSKPTDAHRASVRQRGEELAAKDSEVYSQIVKLRREQDALRPSWGQTLKPKYRKEREAKHNELEKKINELKADKDKLQAEIDKNTAELHSFKNFSFRVFKDASGHYRWVAQSSTAFQDRDKEIVSTKALADDCAFADKTRSYGPLRWWHSPGLDLGDCDFNAMHGRVLIESGTFRTPAIAHKVAAAADGLEISLGFLHLPTEPDASGVFHHIRRFERSLVPRGKASNRFTAFTVKDQSMANQFTPEKIAGMKAIGFTDEDIAGFSAQATSTEKTADGLLIASKAADVPETMVVNGVTYKAALPPEEDMAYTVPQEVVINGVTCKAFAPSLPGNAAEDALDQGADDAQETPMDEAPADENALTISSGDQAWFQQAITEGIQAGISQVMGALDLEKKVAGHVQGLMAPYQATKDAGDAERAQAIAQLQASLKAAQDQQAATQAQLNELLGLQPAVKAERASESTTTTINPWIPQDQQLLQAVKDQVSPNDQFAFGDLVQNLFGNQTPGQA